jgi:hypothetical protein
LAIRLDWGAGSGHIFSMPAASLRRPVLLGFLFEMEGAAAYEDGKDLGDNPYQAISTEARLWRSGWFEARDQAAAQETPP